MRRYITLPGVTDLAQELVQVETFPDGETAITVPDIATKDDIVLVGHGADALAAETFLAAAYEVASHGPARLTVVNLYFRHARCERKFGSPRLHGAGCPSGVYRDDPRAVHQQRRGETVGFPCQGGVGHGLSSKRRQGVPAGDGLRSRLPTKIGTTCPCRVNRGSTKTPSP